MKMQLTADSTDIYVQEGDIEYPFEDTSGVGDQNKVRGNWSSNVRTLLMPSH